MPLDLSGVSAFPYTSRLVLAGNPDTITFSSSWRELWIYLGGATAGAYGTAGQLAYLPPNTWVRAYLRPEQSPISNAGLLLALTVDGVGTLYVADSAAGVMDAAATLSGFPAWATEATLADIETAVGALQTALATLQASVAKQANQTDGTQRAGIQGSDGGTQRNVHVDGSGDLQVDVLSASIAALTDGTQKAQPVDASGNLYGTQSNPLNTVPWGYDGSSRRLLLTDAAGRLQTTTTTLISQATSSVLVYGYDGSANQPIYTDDEGLIINKPYGIAIREGEVSGHTATTITAEVTSATGAWTDLWGGAPGTPVCPILSAAVAMEIVSSSGQDAVGGTGLSQVEIHGLNAAGALTTLVVTMTGGIAVPIGNWLHINTVHGYARGVAGVTDVVAVGNIDVRGAGGGTVYARIPLGRTYDPRMVFRIPAGYIGFWEDVWASCVAISNNNSAQLQIVANQDMESATVLPLGLWVPHGTIGTGAGGASTSGGFRVPYRFAAGVVVKARCRRVSGAGVADGFITGSGWLETT